MCLEKWVLLGYITILHLMACNISQLSKKAKMLWCLVCPAVCWTIWLERNHRVFENYGEPAFNVHKKTKDLFCFGGLNCKGMGEYSYVEAKEGGKIGSDLRILCNSFGCWLEGMPYPLIIKSFLS